MAITRSSAADLGIDERQIVLVTVAGDVEQQRIGKPIETGEVPLDEVWNDLAHNWVILHATHKDHRHGRPRQ